MVGNVDVSDRVIKKGKPSKEWKQGDTGKEKHLEAKKTTGGEGCLSYQV